MKPLVICIDLEQDDDRSSPASLFAWRGAEKALEWGRAQPLQPGAAINWFVRSDMQTRAVLGNAHWPQRHLYEPLRRAMDDGDTVGAHPHLYRLEEDGWRTVYNDTAFSWECAEVALEAHTTVFGEPCRTWRWGSRAGQPALRSRLAGAGVLVDSTAEPGRATTLQHAADIGMPPSYLDHPTEPRVVDGLVDWPISTCAVTDATAPPGGCSAQQPVGAFDAITDQWVVGWCSDAAAGSAHAIVDVELLIHDQVVAVTAADWYRPDLAAAGYGDGCHGARIGMRESWRLLPADAFTLRAVGHGLMSLAPVSDVRTARGAEATVLPLPLETEPQQFARLLATMLRDDTSHLTLASRSEVFLEPVATAAIEQNCRTLLGHIRLGALSVPQSLPALAAHVV
ncbi:MAG TPA: hypothetical protein PK020_14720 [Ilumatobacteraceae bacterium]|nr:hypothetical protein [Ilumatobacteraceae bacterium]HRB02763.1 hypothetical protein [Ilumatobacteraceae bacterium]